MPAWLALKSRFFLRCRLLQGVCERFLFLLMLSLRQQSKFATITESRVVDLKQGHYQIVYETGWRDSMNWVRLVFVPHGSQDPAILVRDEELDAMPPFVMCAAPA
ncbi:MAG: hypothetical protein KatS3mg105_4689 [Gemmatales bacterium]|nr:MAG: hypothetical protein KatS3mg105_4689 [Gemmatales bacterium]